MAARSLRLVHPAPRRASPALADGAGDDADAGDAGHAAHGGDDVELVEAVRRGDRAARGVLYDRYAGHVHRVLYRVLGVDQELGDLHHDVFVQALGSIHRLESPAALRSWLTSIAVFVARSSIRTRKRRRWLWFMPGHEVPDVESGAAPRDVLDALRATYAVLDDLPEDDRIAFALRFIDGMELTEVADACATSLATIKRRLARATDRFERGARKHTVLEAWLEGGTRWGSRS